MSAAENFFNKFNEVPQPKDFGTEDAQNVIKRSRLARKSRIQINELLRSHGLYRYLVDLRQVSHQTSTGKVRSTVAVVVVGNKNGIAGFATAKADVPAKAVEAATKRAIRRLQPITRYANHTLWHEVRAKVSGTAIWMRPRREGSGLIAHTHLAMLCVLSGIRNCSVTLIGNANAMNMTKCFFIAVCSQRTVEEVSLLRGVNLVPLKQRVKVL
ncbi:uncharacterized protein LOC135121083 [Zophobas morio]|uniref:uncharacterized protein LOC135121083 n=1 Tax=Zophobas morio TaxID=2755281 RepID=UPI003083152E